MVDNMNKQEISKQLGVIRGCACDNETAHILEKKLMRNFIKDIAKKQLGELSNNAKLVLSSSDIKFQRWFG